MIAAFGLLLISCSNQENYEKIKRDFQNVQYTELDKSTIDSIFNSIDYSSISENINKLHKNFDKSLILPVLDEDFHANSKETVFRLGAYFADLGYIRHFERVQLCSDYIDVVRNLLNKLAVSNYLFNEYVPRFEENLDNKAVLFELVDSLMSVGKSYFSDTEQYGFGVLLLSGFWLESSFVGFSNVDFDSNNLEYSKIINSHFEVLRQINNLLQRFDDEELISELKAKLLSFYNNKDDVEKNFNDIKKYREDLLK